MSKPVDCQVFQDQLDSLAEGKLPSEGLQGLHAHARSCPECEALLRMHDHLAAFAQSDLEAAVPDEYVEEMWPRVRGAIAKTESSEGRTEGRGRTWGWLVPALAAACLVLIVGSVFLYSELTKIKGRERVLSEQLARLVSMSAELEARTSVSVVEQTAVDRASGLVTGRRLRRALSGRESVTVDELKMMLTKLPPNAEILNAAGAKTAIRRMSPWGADAWRESAAEIRTDDGLQAGEAVHLIDSLGFDPGTSISTARLVALSEGLLRTGAFDNRL